MAHASPTKDDGKEKLLKEEESSLHLMPLPALIAQYETSVEGMKKDVVQKKKHSGQQDNVIPPPLNAPAWLCCLLPCLLATKSMEKFKEAVPRTAQVKRFGRDWVNMEAEGILPGDLIKVSAGDRVAADLRILEAKDCKFDTSMLNGKTTIITCDPSQTTKAYLDSPNMAFVSYLCTSGECKGIAVHTGSNTVLGKMINQKEWPLEEAAKKV